MIWITRSNWITRRSPGTAGVGGAGVPGARRAPHLWLGEFGDMTSVTDVS